MSLLAGKVAVVSGIGPGMGRDISLALAAEGADIVLAARRPEHMAPVQREVEALGRQVRAIPTDITSNEDCRRLADEVGAWRGSVDVLVNNAFAEEDWREFHGFDPARWRRAFDVNVFGTMQLTQSVVPLLKAAGGGSVVMITTLSVRNANPVLGGYASSKGSLTVAARALASELGPHGIRVNCVAPGHIWGESLRVYFAWLAEKRGSTPEAVYDKIAAMNALNHIATSEEIARTVVFFASHLSRVITGQTLDVNCGRTLS